MDSRKSDEQLECFSDLYGGKQRRSVNATSPREVNKLKYRWIVFFEAFRYFSFSASDFG